MITFVLQDKDYNDMFFEIDKAEGYDFDLEDRKKIKGFLQEAGLYRNVPVMELLEQLMNSYWHTKNRC